MFQKIKMVFITLGLASGMTAAALYHYASVEQCRSMVLRDIKAHDAFLAQVGPKDFLTALRGD
jgi:hypothetical protein